MAEKVSPRHDLAIRMASQLSEAGFSVHGPNLVEENNRKHYAVNISNTAYVYATIRVFGVSFIQVDYYSRGRTGMPVFANSLRAITFVKQALLLGAWDKADKVPTKEGTGENHV